MKSNASKPCNNEAPKGVETLTVRADALTRVRKDVITLDGYTFKSRQNLQVRDRWRALSLALGEVQPGEPLRIERQHADYYFTVRDAVMEWAGFPPDPNVRCLVRTPSNLVFWALKDVLEPLPPSQAAGGDAASLHAASCDLQDGIAEQVPQ